MRRLIFIILMTTISSVKGQDLKDYSGRQKYALVIGISKYAISSNDLNYAQKDAEDFSKALTAHGEFKKENMKLLVDREASRENIRKGIEGWLKSNVKKDDIVIIFFSGHGAQIPDTDGDEDDGLDESLVPYDFDNQDYSSLITDDLFAYWIRNLQSENILIIFDNCFSGGAAKQKGVRLPGIKGDIGNDDFMKDISRELPKKGTALLAASKADQVSFESTEFKNGIFTHFLLEAINPSSDNDLNRIISARELFYATKQKTLEYSKSTYKRSQEPIFLDLLTNDIDIFHMPIEKATTPTANSQVVEQLEYQARDEKDRNKELAIYKQLHQLKPTNASYLAHIAWINEGIGHNDDAIEAYKSILALNNSHSQFIPPITSSISRLYKDKGDYDLALSYLKLAIKDEPNSPSLHNEIATLYLLKNDTISAIQNLNKSLSLQPLQKDPYIRSFFLHLNTGNLEAASKVSSGGYDTNPNDFATQYCYFSSQKFIYKSNVPDSVFNAIELNSGIKKRITDVSGKARNVTYIYNNRSLTKEEARIQEFKNAIKDYYYYPEFYKLLIKYVIDNNIELDIETYKTRYLYYSKLNPDPVFAEKYLKKAK